MGGHRRGAQWGWYSEVGQWGHSGVAHEGAYWGGTFGGTVGRHGVGGTVGGHSGPLGPLDSSSSQHRRTPELVLQKSHASFRITFRPPHAWGGTVGGRGRVYQK